MKPSGRERDIEIAKLKGIIVNQPLHSNLYFTYDKNGNYLSELKYYSTGRNAAWELWDELPINLQSCILKRFADKLDYWEMSRKFGDKKDKPNFADYVSQAWLIWKGGKK